jgi:hypothetical protein
MRVSNAVVTMQFVAVYAVQVRHITEGQAVKFCLWCAFMAVRQRTPLDCTTDSITARLAVVSK